MRILILGGSGFIGKALLESLRDEKVSLLVMSRTSNFINYVYGDNCKFVKCSLKMAAYNEEILDFYPDYVVNLCGSSHPRNSIGKEVFELEEYVLPFFELLNALYHKSQKLNVIFASSAGAIYESAQKTQIKEIIDTPYCASKMAIEQYLSSFVYSRDNTSAFSLRISNPIGIVDKEGFGIVNVFSKAVISAQKINFIGDYKNSKDYIAIEDVVSAVIAALKCKKSGYYCLDIASGFALNAKEIYEIIQQYNSGVSRSTIPVKSNFNIENTHRVLGWLPAVNVMSKIENVFDFYNR